MSVDRGKISDLMLSFLKTNVLGEGVDITSSTPFSKIGIDSVTVIELVMHIDDEFGIDIPPNDLTPENMSSVEALAECAMRYVTVDGQKS